MTTHRQEGRICLGLARSEELARELYRLARETYPMNEVPIPLVRRLSLMELMAKDFANLADELISELNAARGYAPVA